jgi:hypothetical protein
MSTLPKDSRNAEQQTHTAFLESFRNADGDGDGVAGN